MNEQKTVIHWFRKGLRLHDNPALVSAIKLVSENVDYVLRPIYMIDPEMNDFVRMGPNRWRFLQQSLVQLDENLNDVNTK